PRQDAHDRRRGLCAGQPGGARALVRHGARHRPDRQGRAGLARPDPLGNRRRGAQCRSQVAAAAPLGHRLPGQGTSAGETLVRALMRTTIARALVGGSLLLAAAFPASATQIDRVVSPAGIEFWLVQEPTVPLIAMDFTFLGGTTQDPDDKPGVASLVAGTIDEGSGSLSSGAFHQALESKAIELSFSATRDYFSGQLRTLVENKDTAFELMRTSINAPRFDPVDLERIRGEIYAILRRESTNPNEIASDHWWATAFAGHPYARPMRGTFDSVKHITADDLRAYMKRVFARDHLKVGIVGNVDAATAGAMVDKVFGALPAHADLRTIADVAPQNLGQVVKVDLDVPQSVLIFGGAGVARKDSDFIPAFLVNQILGGNALTSRLAT